jgi:hypothetical protein
MLSLCVGVRRDATLWWLVSAGWVASSVVRCFTLPRSSSLTVLVDPNGNSSEYLYDPQPEFGAVSHNGGGGERVSQLTGR